MAEETKKLTLITGDGKMFEIEQDIAKQFGILKAFTEEDGLTEFFPFPNVSSPALDKVNEYCRKHNEFRTRAGQKNGYHPADAKAFDCGFVSGLNNNELKELILAANYLHCKELLDLLSQAMADRIKNKSVEYVRKLFGIDNDYTPEEEKDLRERNAWAFEGVVED